MPKWNENNLHILIRRTAKRRKGGASEDELRDQMLSEGCEEALIRQVLEKSQSYYARTGIGMILVGLAIMLVCGVLTYFIYRASSGAIVVVTSGFLLVGLGILVSGIFTMFGEKSHRVETLRIYTDKPVDGKDDHPVAMGHLFVLKQKWFVQLAKDKEFPGYETMLRASVDEPRWYDSELGIEHCAAFLKYVDDNQSKVPRHSSIREALESAIGILEKAKEAEAGFFFAFGAK